MLLDAPTLQAFKAMMGNKFPRMVAYLQEDAEGYITAMIEAMQARHTANFMKAAHALKSGARQIGAQQLAEHAAFLEEEARQESLPENKAIFEETLHLLLAQTVQALQETCHDS